MTIFKVTRSSILLVLGLVLLLSGCNLPQNLFVAKSPTPSPAPASTPTRPAATRPAASPTPLPTPVFTATPLPSATPFPPVTVDTVTVLSKFMNGMPRIARVYLPGEYAANPAKRYKVLYAFDG
jgi:hypothetical protein